MKNPLILAAVLLLLLGSCFFLIANCGGRDIVQTTDTTTTVKGWQVVGNPAFSSGEARDIKLVVSRGIPYVAYIDVPNQSRITVMKFNGTSWESVGPVAFSDSGAAFCDFSIDNDALYVAYDGHYLSSDPKILRISTTGQVMKFNGTSWEGLSKNGIIDSQVYAIALNVANGMPYFAYSTNDIFNISVAKYDGTNWADVGSRNFTDSIVYDFSMSCYNGAPYVIFSDSTHLSAINAGIDGRATVMRYNGSTWETVGLPGFSTGNVTSTHIMIDNGTIYAAFDEAGFPTAIGDDLVPKASVMKFNGSSWEAVGKPGFSADEVLSTTLFVYNGTPYVAYRDRSIPYGLDKLSVMKFDGSSWGYVGAQGFSGTVTGVKNVSLFIYNGIPYVAYSDNDNGKRVTVMRYIE